MVTDALSPLRVIETFQDCVEPTGTIGVMSSGQGSVANNTNGGHEVYRGSKAALNSYMRSYDARHRGEQRTLILMAPGWVKTDLGGPDARLTIEESIPGVVKVIDSLRGQPGLHYVDYLGRPSHGSRQFQGSLGGSQRSRRVRPSKPGRSCGSLSMGTVVMVTLQQHLASVSGRQGQDPVSATHRTIDAQPARRVQPDDWPVRLAHR